MSIEHTQAIMERYWAGDYDAIAEDAVFIDVASGNRYEGRAAVVEMLEDHYTRVFEASFELEHRHIASGSAAIEGRFVGTHVGEYQGVAGSGKKVDIPLAVFYTVGDDGITEGRVWFMLSSYLQQVQAPPFLRR